MAFNKSCHNIPDVTLQAAHEIAHNLWEPQAPTQMKPWVPLCDQAALPSLSMVNTEPPAMTLLETTLYHLPVSGASWCHPSSAIPGLGNGMEAENNEWPVWSQAAICHHWRNTSCQTPWVASLKCSALQALPSASILTKLAFRRMITKFSPCLVPSLTDFTFTGGSLRQLPYFLRFASEETEVRRLHGHRCKRQRRVKLIGSPSSSPYHSAPLTWADPPAFSGNRVSFSVLST